MRVIAGLHRSRRLVAPRGTATRPTSDRLRETLFNILGAQIDGARFLDLYAGTGAVGIEALSRGAAHVFFSENAPPALAALRENLSTLKIASGYTLDDRGTGALLARLAEAANRMDLVYLDPPYEAANEYTATLSLLGSARGQLVLVASARVIAEHSSKILLPDRFGQLRRTRLLKQGDAALSFYSVTEQSRHPHAPPSEDPR